MVTIEEISPVKKKLHFEIPWEETRKSLDNAYRIIAKTARVKGFRPGKTPRSILERYYRAQAEEETITDIFNHYFWEAVKEHGLDIIARPEVDQQGITAGQSFSFSATVEVEPVFDPEGYLGLEIDREEVEVTEDDIAARLVELRETYSTMEETDGEAEAAPGLYAIIDFQGALDGEPLKELKADDYLLEIGSGSFVPGFEEQMAGMKKGERRELTVKFPDDYHFDKVAGKEVVFSVQLKNIKEKELPQIDEEFIKNFDQFNSLDELREDIRAKIEVEKTQKAAGDMRVAIMDRLLEMNSFPAPEILVERQISAMMADTQWRMTMRGIGRDEATAMLPQYHDLYKDDATRVVRSLLLMKRMAAKENVAVEDEELDARIREMAVRRGHSYELYRENLEKENMIDEIRMELKNRKVMELIEARAVIRPVKKTPAATGGVK